ncbi:hypothetical protein [Georgenia daeguensis]|uniref:Uncharacterized protein n=1 Tax=Georgenia daeguensis TaxID=908355 RepID=A0ABP6ULM3_9MICO
MADSATTSSATTRSATSKTRPERAALGAMYVGLALTVVAAITPYIDRATGNLLATHLRAGYPSYTQDRVDSAVTTWLVYLSVLGALGLITWLVTIWAVRTDRRWARPVTTLVLALGLGVGLFNLLVTDTSGDTGLPLLLGSVGMLPSLAGLLAVTLLWRGGLRRAPRRGPAERALPSSSAS